MNCWKKSMASDKAKTLHLIFFISKHLLLFHFTFCLIKLYNLLSNFIKVIFYHKNIFFLFPSMQEKFFSEFHDTNLLAYPKTVPLILLEKFLFFILLKWELLLRGGGETKVCTIKQFS